MLNDMYALSGESTLLAEAENIDACACSDGCEEEFKGGWCAGHWGLVGEDGEFAEVRVHTRVVGEGDEYVHEVLLQKIFATDYTDFHEFIINLCEFVKPMAFELVLSTASAAFIALELKFDLGFKLKRFVFLWIWVTGFVTASQCGGEDVFQLVSA